MRQNIKITKQQMKEDKFTTTMLISRDWLMKNWQPVALTAAAVIVVIVGIVLYSDSQKSGEAAGETRLSNAISILRQNNFQGAIVELNDIIDNYGGDVAASATFLLGNAYYGARNYDDAMASYQKYYDKHHRDKLTSASALGGIAACHENKQEFEKAAEQYMTAFEYYPESANAPDYLLGAVRNYVNLGNKEKANEILKTLESDFAGSEQHRAAVMLSAKLNS